MSTVVIKSGDSNEYGARVTAGGELKTITRIHDSQGQIAEVDDLGVLVQVPTGTYMVHEANMFHASSLNVSVADDAVYEFLVRTSGTEFSHLSFNVACSGNAQVMFYEGPEETASGTNVRSSQMNRPHVATLADTTNQAKTQVYEAPTIVASGTQLMHVLAPLGQLVSNPRPDTEWVLKQNRDYLISVRNISGGANPVSIACEYYETAVDVQ